MYKITFDQKFIDRIALGEKNTTIRKRIYQTGDTKVVLPDGRSAGLTIEIKLSKRVAKHSIWHMLEEADPRSLGFDSIEEALDFYAGYLQGSSEAVVVHFIKKEQQNV